MPRNCSSARGKVVAGQATQVRQGSTSATFGDVRHHGGKIAEENRLPSP
jgi:hypothetical protein